jgi:hypothetical protein
MALLGLPGLLETGVVLERTLMELHDETPPEGPLPPVAAGCGEEAPVDADEDRRPAPLLSGPLSFDS